MDVKPISNSQPSFNGYLGRNIQTYVNHTVEKEINSVVNEANVLVTKVDVKRIKDIKSLGDSVLNKLSDFVGRMNNKTSLDLNDIDTSYIRFFFKNSIAPSKEVKLYPARIYSKPTLRNDVLIVPEASDLSKISDASIQDLRVLDRMADKLLDFNASKSIDEIFYHSASQELKTTGEKATVFWSKLKVRKFAKALDEFAKGLGIDGSARVRAEEYFKVAKERKISNKNFLKEMKENSKNNQKLADEVLKG